MTTQMTRLEIPTIVPGPNDGFTSSPRWIGTFTDQPPARGQALPQHSGTSASCPIRPGRSADLFHRREAVYRDDVSSAEARRYLRRLFIEHAGALVAGA